MRSGLCTLSIVPLRKEPSSTSEMVSQLLFGETYKVLEEKNEWLRIRTSFDHYEGWINGRQHFKISEATLKKILDTEPVYCTKLVSEVTDSVTNHNIPISLGADLRICHMNGVLDDRKFFSSDKQGPIRKGNAETILKTAVTLLDAPYLWGGRSTFGIDCSGFTQTVMKLNGYNLPRDAREQVELGEPLNFVEEAEPGDLAFFDNDQGNIVHVGFVMPGKKIIHASGRVRIDPFDHYGIHATDLKRYSHHLRVIKRVL